MDLKNKRYYRVDIIAVSPLSLCSGLSRNSRADVLLDSRGLPCIPATSLAGVLASRLGSVDKERLYGKISANGDSEKSHVIFYDAQYISGGATVSVRDGVALENKVALHEAKFDFEVVEPGCCFRGYIELDDTVSESDEKLLLSQLSAVNDGILRFGHKTTRGFGRVKIQNLKRTAFSEVTDWLAFDMYDDSSWQAAEDVSLDSAFSDVYSIKVSLELLSALSIRSYTTEAATAGQYAPDYKFLALRNGRPVIPGTTWAGVFRERVAQLLGVYKGKDMKDLFGYVEKGGKETVKSKILFSESIFDAGSYDEKLVTRNSIDRFSAATNDGALYTEKTFYGGTTSLEIILPKSCTEKQKAALVAALKDLDNGFLAVGGLTSVGRGIFKITSIFLNGEDRTKAFKEEAPLNFFGGEDK